MLNFFEYEYNKHHDIYMTAHKGSIFVKILIDESKRGRQVCSLHICNNDTNIDNVITYSLGMTQDEAITHLVSVANWMVE